MNASRVLISVISMIGLLARTAKALTIETVPVGNPGNVGELSGGQYDLSNALTHNYLAAIAVHERQFARARDALDACLALGRQAGYTGSIELAHATSALLAVEEGDPVRAKAALRESLFLQESIQEQWRALDLLDTVAVFLVSLDEALSAGRLFGAAHHLREVGGIRRFARHHEPYEFSLNRLREQLDAATLDDAWAAPPS